MRKLLAAILMALWRIEIRLNYQALDYETEGRAHGPREDRMEDIRIAIRQQQADLYKLRGKLK